MLLLLALALLSAGAALDRQALMLERVAQATMLVQEFPNEAYTIKLLATYHLEVDLSEVAEFRRRLGNLDGWEINDILQRVFMPLVQETPPPPPRMSVGDFIDHMAVLHLFEKRNNRPLRTQSITPQNILHVRRFIHFTKFMPRTVIYAMLQENIGSLQDLDMPDVDLPTFAEIRNALPRDYYEENREWFESFSTMP